MAHVTEMPEVQGRCLLSVGQRGLRQNWNSSFFFIAFVVLGTGNSMAALGTFFFYKNIVFSAQAEYSYFLPILG